MRRSLIAFALGLCAACALASGALAKEGVELSSTPFGTLPGETWSGTLTVIGEPVLIGGVKPSIRLTNLDTGETRTFAMRGPAKIPTTAETRSFIFDVVFPTPGRYSYTVYDGVTDREYTYPPVRIVGSEAVVPVPSSGGERSFPVWAPVMGGIALLLVAGGAGLYARRRRFGLSH